MKKYNPIHAKLYIDVIFNNNVMQCLYKQNQFDINGKRIIQKEDLSDDFEFSQKDKYLVEKNIYEMQILNNYIKIQKKVLEKHQKSGNYDAYNIIKNSLNTVCEFKKDFDDWFNENRIFFAKIFFILNNNFTNSNTFFKCSFSNTS